MMPSPSSLPQTISTIQSSTASSTSTSPCAACKFLRRKCQPDCIFAPYFPPDNPQKFVHVHRVFGASNVTKILNELPTCHREDAVNSLAYEADMRLRDPVYGCVGVISILQRQLRQLQIDLSLAKAELLKYQNSIIITNNNDDNGENLNSPMGNLGQFMNVGSSCYYQPGAGVVVRSLERETVNGGGHDGNFMVSDNSGGGGVLGGQFLKMSTNGRDALGLGRLINNDRVKSKTGN